MKKEPLNNFSDDTRLLFVDCYCWECGANNVSDPHHIFGRGTKNDDSESSPLNLAPLCRKCHNTVGKNKNEKRYKYFWKTYFFLQNNGYVFTAKEMSFINKYLK